MPFPDDRRSTNRLRLDQTFLQSCSINVGFSLKSCQESEADPELLCVSEDTLRTTDYRAR